MILVLCKLGKFVWHTGFLPVQCGLQWVFCFLKLHYVDSDVCHMSGDYTTQAIQETPSIIK